jgi:hypothetical protein
MWFLNQKVILTKDNLIKRNWIGFETFCFCDCKESIQHLFFHCPFAKVGWCIIYMTLAWLLLKTSLTCLEIGSRAFQRRNWFRLGWEYALLFGQCGTQGTILFLANENQLYSCRLSLRSPIGSIHGLIYNKRSRGRRWILGATVWRWSLGIYSTGVAGGRIEESLHRWILIIHNLVYFFVGWSACTHYVMHEPSCISILNTE